MLAYKCKCCGSGELEPLGDGRKAQCVYCNTVMVLPTLQPETYNHANDLRLKCDFDQAVMSFERIVSENPEDSESYWNLLLSRYGIEYVETKKGSGIYTPTCHRMTYQSILEDEDYQKALKYADGFSYRLYQDEAAKIDRVLKRAAQIAQSQPPYDIFISYKESNADKSRTEDSTIAQNIYDALKEKHPELKIFLSRVTLKEVAAGLEYEPIIFSALNSAKLMIVVGTSRENLEATWVKNEWSRYRKMMDREKNKYMTVVYGKGMKLSEDFPDGLRLFSIQATEATGFYMQDFIAGVEELLDIKAKPVIDSSQIFQTTTTRQIDNLLKRAEQAIEIGNKAEAKSFYEKVLGIDAECATAWWGLFNLDTNERKYVDDTKSFTLSAEASNYWRMVQRYATGENLENYKSAYEEYVDFWNAAYEKREHRLNVEATKKRVSDAISEMKSNTDNGMAFENYKKYGPDSQFFADTYRQANDKQKQNLDEFAQKYRRNYNKFMELQEVKSTNPPAIIKSGSKYVELNKVCESAEKEKNKYERKLSSLGTLGVIFAILVIISSLIYAFATVSTSSLAAVAFWTMPFIVGHMMFKTLLDLFGLAKKKSVAIILPVIPAAVLQVFIYSFVIKGAQQMDPTISTVVNMLGPLYGILLVGGPLLFVGFCYVKVRFAILSGILSFVMFYGLALLEENEVLTGTLVSDEYHISIKTGYFLFLAVIALGITVLRILIRARRKTIQDNYDRASGALEVANKERDSYYSAEISKYTEPFKAYVSEKYFENMSSRDI